MNRNNKSIDCFGDICIFLIERYRRRRDRLVELAAAAPIPTMWGPFKAYCYRSLLDGIEHIAMVKVSCFIQISSHLMNMSLCILCNTKFKLNFLDLVF